MKLELAVCFFALIAPVLLIVELATGASFPVWVFMVPIFIYGILFVTLIIETHKRGG